MIASCPTIADDAGFAERLAAYVECRSAQIDLAAFQGGLWHGLPAALVSALIALYIAVIGYRLILHHHFDTAALIYAGFRLGIVIALTTTLSAYSTLVYTVATQGPEELAAMALAPTGLRVSSPTEASHQAAEDLASLAGPPQAGPATAAPEPVGDAPAKPLAPSQAAPSPAPAQGLGGATFVLSCAGFGVAARLALAIVLASGPLFIATALFDVSIGLCIGWLRALVALFLAQAGFAVSSALELSFFAQDVERLSSASLDANEPMMVGLFFLVAGVAITLVAVLAAGGLVCFSPGRRISSAEAPRTGTQPPPDLRSQSGPAEIRLDHAPSRAQRVTDAVGALAEAEHRRNGGGESITGSRALAASGPATEGLAGTSPGLRRPGQLRASTSGTRRDGIS